MRMRIAILHYTQPPVIGGVERVIGEQANALVAMGHEVSVFDRSADAHVRFHAWLPLVSKADEGVCAARMMWWSGA